MKNCKIKNVECADIDSITKPFKVGDKVYVGLTGRVAKVTEIIDDEVVSVAKLKKITKCGYGQLIFVMPHKKTTKCYQNCIRILRLNCHIKKLLLSYQDEV